MKQKLYILLCVIILIVCVFTTNVLGTTALEDLHVKQSEISNQIQGSNTQLEEVQSELSEVMLQIQELNEKIRNYENEAQGLDEKIVELKQYVESSETRLQIAQKNYNKQKKALEDRLVAMYEAGETTYLDVLLSSKSITDFISKYYLLSEITAYDTEFLETVESQKNKIQAEKDALTQKREELKLAKDNKEKTAITLANTQIIKNNYMNQLSNEEKKLQEEIDLYDKQFDEIEKEILQITTANISSEYIGGEMAWPVPRIYKSNINFWNEGSSNNWSI